MIHRYPVSMIRTVTVAGKPVNVVISSCLKSVIALKALTDVPLSDASHVPTKGMFELCPECVSITKRGAK